MECTDDHRQRWRRLLPQRIRRGLRAQLRQHSLHRAFRLRATAGHGLLDAFARQRAGPSLHRLHEWFTTDALFHQGEQLRRADVGRSCHRPRRGEYLLIRHAARDCEWKSGDHFPAGQLDKNRPRHERRWHRVGRAGDDPHGRKSPKRIPREHRRRQSGGRVWLCAEFHLLAEIFPRQRHEWGDMACAGGDAKPHRIHRRFAAIHGARGSGRHTCHRAPLHDQRQAPLHTQQRGHGRERVEHGGGTGLRRRLAGRQYRAKYGVNLRHEAHGVVSNTRRQPHRRPALCRGERCDRHDMGCAVHDSLDRRCRALRDGIGQRWQHLRRLPGFHTRTEHPAEIERRRAKLGDHRSRPRLYRRGAFLHDDGGWKSGGLLPVSGCALFHPRKRRRGHDMAYRIVAPGPVRWRASGRAGVGIFPVGDCYWWLVVRQLLRRRLWESVVQTRGERGRHWGLVCVCEHRRHRRRGRLLIARGREWSPRSRLLQFHEQNAALLARQRHHWQRVGRSGDSRRHGG